MIPGLNFTAIDFETANDKRSSACSIGLAVVENGEIIATYYKLIKPYPLEVGYWQQQVHGLTIEDLTAASEFSEVWKEIEPVISNRILVAHNASFDRSVLSHLLEHYKIERPLPEFCCTYQLSKKTWPNQISYKLSHIASELKFELDHHNALSDAKGAARVAIEIFKMNAGISISDLVMNAYRRKQSSALDLSRATSKALEDKKPNSIQSIINEVEVRRNSMFPDMEEDPTHPFYQKVIVFTGGLIRMEREVAHRLVRQLGGIVAEGVTKKTNVLVNAGMDQKYGIDAFASGKSKKAKEYKEKGQDIEILNEIQFYTLLGI